MAQGKVQPRDEGAIPRSVGGGARGHTTRHGQGNALGSWGRGGCERVWISREVLCGLVSANVVCKVNVLQVHSRGNVLFGPIGDPRVNNRQIATCSEGVQAVVYRLRDVDEGLVVWALTEGQCGVAPVEMPSRRQLRLQAVVWGEVVRLHVFAWGNRARAGLQAIKSMVDGWGEQWHVSSGDGAGGGGGGGGGGCGGGE